MNRMTEYAEARPYCSDWKASVYTWVIQICEAPAGPPPVMIHTSTKELRLATNNRIDVITITPRKVGTVTCQKRFQALAPSTRAALSNCWGTVCRPASSMIIANGNSFHTFATINDGMTSLVESRKLIGESMTYDSYSTP